MDFLDEFGDVFGYDDFVGSNSDHDEVQDEDKHFDPSGVTTPEDLEIEEDC